MRKFYKVELFLIILLLFFKTKVVFGETAEIIIDFEPVKEVSTYIFGHNSIAYDPCYRKIKNCKNEGEYTNFGAGQWDPFLRKPDSALLNLAKNIKVSVLRFPGGCGAHHYDWKKAIGPVEKRPMYQFGIDEFMKLCKALGAEPIITLSYFTGTCQDLADLVEYLNAPLGTNPNGGIAWAEVRAKNGHPEPYGVKWFEFGNEVWHGDHRYISAVEPWDYAKRYLACKQLIKNADPNILLGAVALEGEYGLNEWSKTVVKILKTDLDFLIIHIYRPWYRSNEDEISANELFKITLASPDQIKDILENIARELKELTGKTVPIAVTEYNGSFVQQKPVPYRHSLGNALFIADLLRVFLTVNIPILSANYWQFSNSYWGLIYNPDYMKGKGKYYKRPNYYVFELYANHFGNILIKTQVQSSGYTQPGFNKIRPTVKNPVKISDVRREYPINKAKISPFNWETGDIQKLSCVKVFKKNEYLELHFNCDQDINFFHINFSLNLKPGHIYQLKGLMKAENFQSSGNGVRLEVQDLRGWQKVKWARSTLAVKDTTDWVPVSVEFTPPADSQGVKVLIRQWGGGGPIQGIVKIKDVVIEDLGPVPQYGPTPYISAIASTNEKKDRIYLLVINKNLEEPVKTQIKINGFSFDPQVQAWVLNGPSVASTNENEQESVKIYYHKVEVEQKNGTFWFTFEPHSVTALELVQKIN